MKLILVRHGESERNAEVVTVANGLTEKGKGQAKKVARFLSQEKIGVIYCSQSERCIQTMEEILKDREGDEIQIHFSRLIGAMKKSEDFVDLRKKIDLLVDDLKFEHQKDETVMIISHKLIIEMIIRELTGELFEIDNGSTTIMEIKNNEIKRILVNEKRYLD